MVSKVEGKGPIDPPPPPLMPSCNVFYLMPSRVKQILFLVKFIYLQTSVDSYLITIFGNKLFTTHLLAILLYATNCRKVIYINYQKEYSKVRWSPHTPRLYA